MIKRCPYCNSIWVCWNWVYAFGGNRKEFEEANPHIDSKDLRDWGHECWSCGGVSETYNKVRNGIPYWFLKKFYYLFTRKEENYGN